MLTRGRQWRPCAIGALVLVGALAWSASVHAGPRPAATPPSARDVSPPPAWVTIPAGQFQMGCVPGDSNCRGNEQRRRDVRITRPFRLMTTEVTIGHFEALSRKAGMRTPRQPRWNRTPRHPVVNVTWAEATAVCAAMDARLPTEAEWEYAARGGGDGQIFWWGDTFERRFANIAGTGRGDPWPYTAAAGSLPANAFGLHEMAGNVWEWTADWYVAASPPQLQIDPTGPSSGTQKVIRGGSWDSTQSRVRNSARISLPVEARYNLYVGFRCAR